MGKLKNPKTDYAAIAIKEVNDPFENITSLNTEEADLESKAYIIYERRINDGKRKKLAYYHDPFESEEIAKVALRDRVDKYAKNEDPKFGVQENADGTYTVESADKTFKSTFFIKKSSYYYGMIRGNDIPDFNAPGTKMSDGGSGSNGIVVTFSTPTGDYKKTEFGTQREAMEYKDKLAKNLQSILGEGAVKRGADNSIIINTPVVKIR